MNITFYNFSKRNNSTKQPTGGTVVSCELKSQTTIIAPSIIIKNVPSGLTTAWNYCYIPDFSRYYFITNWTWLNGVWEIACSVDVLASFKTAIGGMTEYILRSASESDGEVVDLQYPTTAEVRVNNTLLSSPFSRTFTSGYYVVGIISNDSSSAQGAVTYYQMSASQLADLKHYMMSDTFITDNDLDLQTVTDVLPTEILKTLYDPFKYIASCIWMPFPSGDYDSGLKTSANVKFGWYTPSTTISGYRLNSGGYVKTYSQRTPIYGHTQRPNRGVFLDHPPFSDRMLFYPPYGSIPINDDSIIGGDAIRMEILVDMALGDSILTVFHDRPNGEDTYTNMGVLARVSAPLGVPIQLAQTTIDIGGSITAAETFAAQGTVQAFIGSAKKADGSLFGFLGTVKDTLQGGMNASLSAIGDVISNPVGQLMSSGSNGSMAQYCANPYFVQKFRIVANDDNAQKGRPLCAARQINTLSGFIMVDSPDVSLNCFEPERQQIMMYMSNGFFYE